MKTLLVLLVLSLSGCAEFGAAKSGIANYGAKAADETRIIAEWTLCQAISVGAFRRAYGTDPAKAEAWRKLCSDSITVTP